MIEKHLVEILPQAQQVLFSEGGHLVLACAVISHEHVVDGEPDLSFDFSELAAIMSLNLLPLLVFKLLLFTSSIGADPGLGLQ